MQLQDSVPLYKSCMEDVIINKVAESGLITLDLEEYYPKEQTAVFDLKDHLFMGLILKEKEYRETLKKIDWDIYKNKNVCITCSADAVKIGRASCRERVESVEVG